MKRTRKNRIENVVEKEEFLTDEETAIVKKPKQDTKKISTGKQLSNKAETNNEIYIDNMNVDSRNVETSQSYDHFNNVKVYEKRKSTLANSCEDIYDTNVASKKEDTYSKSNLVVDIMDPIQNMRLNKNNNISSGSTTKNALETKYSLNKVPDEKPNIYKSLLIKKDDIITSSLHAINTTQKNTNVSENKSKNEGNKSNLSKNDGNGFSVNPFEKIQLSNDENDFNIGNNTVLLKTRDSDTLHLNNQLVKANIIVNDFVNSPSNEHESNKNRKNDDTKKNDCFQNEKVFRCHTPDRPPPLINTVPRKNKSYYYSDSSKKTKKYTRGRKLFFDDNEGTLSIDDQLLKLEGEVQQIRKNRMLNVTTITGISKVIDKKLKGKIDSKDLMKSNHCEKTNKRLEMNIIPEDYNHTTFEMDECFHGRYKYQIGVTFDTINHITATDFQEFLNVANFVDYKIDTINDMHLIWSFKEDIIVRISDFLSNMKGTIKYSKMKHDVKFTMTSIQKVNLLTKHCEPTSLPLEKSFDD